MPKSLDGLFRHQSTLRKEIVFHGIGVHTGTPSTLILKPADAGSGIVFHHQGCATRVCWQNVSDTKLSTTLCNEKGYKIQTIEHLLAACYGLGVTNLEIDLIGSEIPIADGSSAPFIEAFQSVGFERQKQEASFLVMKKDLTVVQDQGRIIKLSPSLDPTISVCVTLGNYGIQQHRFPLFSGRFAQEIGGARTFANLSDIQKLRAAGLIRGGSLDVALVLEKGQPINPGGFRLEQECARHKILDIIGDFATLGHFFFGNIESHMPGHSLNHLAIQKLFACSSHFEILSWSQLKQSVGQQALAAQYASQKQRSRPSSVVRGGFSQGTHPSPLHS
jgi:UDP-3-O-[3-hydroxymyristoyl] N-acetylglucosamine deacetylase